MLPVSEYTSWEYTIGPHGQKTSWKHTSELEGSPNNEDSFIL